MPLCRACRLTLQRSAHPSSRDHTFAPVSRLPATTLSLPSFRPICRGRESARLKLLAVMCAATWQGRMFQTGKRDWKDCWQACREVSCNVWTWSRTAPRAANCWACVNCSYSPVGAQGFVSGYHDAPRRKGWLAGVPLDCACLYTSHTRRFPTIHMGAGSERSVCDRGGYPCFVI